MPTPLNQKPATAAWIVRERKRLTLKPRDLVTRLAAQGLVVTEATVKVWESNADRRPSPENLEGLERIFGSTAPGTETPTGDQSALIAALDRQSNAIEALVVLLARREGITLLELAEEAEGPLVDRIAAAALTPAATEAVTRDRDREIADLIRRERRLRAPQPAKP